MKMLRSINGKLIILVLGTFLITILIIVYFTRQQAVTMKGDVTRVVLENADREYDLRLMNVHDRIEQARKEVESLMVSFGLTGTDIAREYEREARFAVLEELRGTHYDREKPDYQHSWLFIVDQDSRVLLHPHLEYGDEGMQWLAIPDHLESGPGEHLSYEMQGRKHIMFLKEHAGWNWFLGFSVLEDHLFAPAHRVEQSINRFSNRILVASFFIAALFVVLLHYALRFFVLSRLKEFTAFAENVEVVDLESKEALGKALEEAPASSDDEIGLLSRAFSGMLKRLADYVQEREELLNELSSKNKKLEEEVNERLIVEEALRVSEERFRTLVENAHDGIYIMRGETYIYVNDMFCDITGYSKQEILTDRFNFGSLLSDDSRDIIQSRYEKRLKGEEIPGMYEIEIVRKDGVPRPVEVNTAQIHNPEALTIIGVMRDISERKQAEELIRNSLEEKNVLLSEIHHRVKNNMAVISSLLALQSEFSGYKNDAEGLLRETQGRIKSMALVHELVYEQKNFAKIDVSKLLKRLVENLQKSYERDDCPIALHTNIEPLMLNMELTIPLSLFANEVILNAYKHAFKGRKEGRIDVVLKKEGKGYRFVVADNGVGVDDLEKLNQPDTFGYTIIHGLAGQVRGKLSFVSPADREPGEGGLRVEAFFSP